MKRDRWMTKPITTYQEQLKAQYNAPLPPIPPAANAFDDWVDVEYTCQWEQALFALF